jgi:hypothetical protein
MKHVFIPREGDKERFFEYESHFRECSDQELNEAYQRQARCGMTGVHAQAVYLLALKEVMEERFGESPVTLEDGGIIDLSRHQNIKD